MLELQPHHTMRPLSIDKLNIVISRLHSGQTTCQILSSTGVSIGTISKIHSEHCSDLLTSSGGCPVKLSPANVHHAVNFITSGKTVPRSVFHTLVLFASVILNFSFSGSQTSISLMLPQPKRSTQISAPLPSPKK